MFYFFFPFTTNSVHALSAEYYRINNAHTYLYSDISLSEEYKLFLLPETYFVKAKLDPIQNSLNVEYNGITGYVNLDNLTPVYQAPTTPFATHIISLLPVSNAIIYSRPSTSSPYLGTIPFDATSILVYGKCTGEQSIANSSTDWYYIKYSSTTQGIITGYIYHSVISSFTPALPNTEILQTSPSTPTTTTPIISPELQDTNNILVIILISIPLIILTYILLVPHKKQSKHRNKHNRQLLNYIDKNATKDEFDF